jgi:serine/threonine protein phosphatase 1
MAKSQSASPRLPDGRRIYAIGDIHGRADLLEEMRAMIATDLAAMPAAVPAVIYLGDYIDRGPDPAAVVTRLIEAPSVGVEEIFLKGNHEDFLIRFLDGEDDILSWLLNGGDTTFDSYGVDLPVPFPGVDLSQVRTRLADAIPEAHVRFFRALGSFHAEGGYYFTHAGVRPGVALEDQSDDDRLWIREEFLHSDADFGACVVHGHTIDLEPAIRRNRIGIDTGAYFTGRLTCAIFEKAEIRLLAT